MRGTRLGKGALPNAATCQMRFITACDGLKELENRLYGCEAEYKDALRATGGIPVTPAQNQLAGLITGYSEAIGVLRKALSVNVRAKKPRKPKKS